ncbi:hypothetical protein DFA_03305 [Cavenderia fasciculata]|uniref:Uncharacterized protein n=1 Tax=Cavenderia fasciculata TaxID=261658 RepID=F4PH75_CACFS|nr:uncharacterized protein DFA_03305 [Cavenderia fasciculata]EGG25059.1 hypothetical protein DFA_03305 [Cavenderia fasciculata]|eukprot:XP_004362910.1 hypothetical protein DFA_03305 [Cavenderia fasciculata]
MDIDTPTTVVVVPNTTTMTMTTIVPQVKTSTIVEEKVMDEERETMRGNRWSIPTLKSNALYVLKNTCYHRGLKPKGNKDAIVDILIKDIIRENGEDHFKKIEALDTYGHPELGKFHTAKDMRAAAERSGVAVTYLDTRSQLYDKMLGKLITPFANIQDPFKLIPNVGPRTQYRSCARDVLDALEVVSGDRLEMGVHVGT